VDAIREKLEALRQVNVLELGEEERDSIFMAVVAMVWDLNNISQIWLRDEVKALKSEVLGFKQEFSVIAFPAR